MAYTFAIGDVHGCIDPLKRLISRIEMARPEGGTVVFLGDYIDRGPDSKGVVDLLIAGPQKPGWKWVALKGNHEDMMVSCVNGENPLEWWIGNGGAETLASYGGELTGYHLDWADELPLKHADEHRVYVHACMDGTLPYDEQSEQEMLWSRKPPHFSGEYWGKHLVHGHTPISEATTTGNRTNVDSACVFGGKLSCAVFDDDMAGGPIEFMTVPAA
jgi:serine/threonine protein phosphatase 1